MKDNFIGRRFGRLLVIGFAGKSNGKTNWHCVCDCGKSRRHVKVVDRQE